MWSKYLYCTLHPSRYRIISLKHTLTISFGVLCNTIIDTRCLNLKYICLHYIERKKIISIYVVHIHNIISNYSDTDTFSRSDCKSSRPRMDISQTTKYCLGRQNNW